jgi:divalent metal cation (Fe/Co/Zn/Cd) transporter
VDPGTSVERAHEIAETAESAVRKSLPGADVTIHVEPGTPGKEAAGESLQSRVRRIASRIAMGAHDVRLLDVLGRRRLELHLEVSDRLNVGSAHEVATAFEAEIRAIEPGLDRVVTHIEPALEVAKPKALCPPAEDAVADVVRRLAREQDARCTPHEIEVRRVDDELQVSLHCTLSAETGIVDAHDFTERLERTLAEQVPGLKRAVIHVEPPEGRADAPKP